MINHRQPVHAGDREVIGHLWPRPISLCVQVAFGSRPVRFEVRGFHRRLHGIAPDKARN